MLLFRIETSIAKLCPETPHLNFPNSPPEISAYRSEVIWNQLFYKTIHIFNLAFHEMPPKSKTVWTVSWNSQFQILGGGISQKVPPKISVYRSKVILKQAVSWKYLFSFSGGGQFIKSILMKQAGWFHETASFRLQLGGGHFTNRTLQCTVQLSIYRPTIFHFLCSKWAEITSYVLVLTSAYHNDIVP